MKRIVKAYKNIDFLNSPDARTIRILAEYYEPASRFRKYKIKDTIVFFGSSRILHPEQAKKNYNHIKRQIKKNGRKTTALSAELHRAEVSLKSSKYYTDAMTLASMITKWSSETAFQKKGKGRRFIICSGGGSGIMEAANRGAFEANGHSIGLNISLPFEQKANHYISKELMFEFHYFFIRKFWFVYLAKALIIFPGGYGTIDEMMELLTLIQTGKTKKNMPVIIYGTDYWKGILNFDGLVEWGMISPEDLNLFHFSDTPEDAFGFLKTKLERLQ
jgi:uncharacterized protein (TIGR00730 family)